MRLRVSELFFFLVFYGAWMENIKIFLEGGPENSIERIVAMGEGAMSRRSAHFFRDSPLAQDGYTDG
jgi:hypothetical protein